MNSGERGKQSLPGKSTPINGLVLLDTFPARTDQGEQGPERYWYWQSRPSWLSLCLDQRQCRLAEKQVKELLSEKTARATQTAKDTDKQRWPGVKTTRDEDSDL